MKFKYVLNFVILALFLLSLLFIGVGVVFALKGDFLETIIALFFAAPLLGVAYLIHRFNKAKLLENNQSSESNASDESTGEVKNEINLNNKKSNNLRYTLNNIPSEYISFDIETTGLLRKDEIIQISASHYLNGGEIDSFNTYVKPSIIIPQKITNLTNITNEDVKDAPKIDVAIKHFLDFIEDNILTGYNIKNFDIPKIKYLTGIDLKQNPVFDALDLVKEAQLDTPNNKLENIKYYYGINLVGHDALNDSRATAQIIEKLRKKDFLSQKIPSNPLSSLDGLNFCITGKMNLGRDPIVDLIESNGGTAKNHMSRNIDYFIVGPQVAHNTILPNKSSKEVYYDALVEEGYNIEKISEDEFLEMIQWNTND